MRVGMHSVRPMTAVIDFTLRGLHSGFLVDPSLGHSLSLSL